MLWAFSEVWEGGGARDQSVKAISEGFSSETRCFGSGTGPFWRYGDGLSLFPSDNRRFVAAFYAACTRLRSLSFCFSLIRPRAIASITIRARSIRKRILARPRMKWFSKPNDTSRRLLTRSTAVRFL